MKYKKDEIWQVRTEMFEFRNSIGTKAKKKDRVCGECGREYEIGEMVGMMTIHGKSNIHLCTSCGNKYIELGAIDINENRRIRSELESKIYSLNKYEKLEGIETCNLQPIIDRLEKERDEYLRLQKEIEDNKPSKEDWEIEEYLISQYNVYQDENYLTHESQIEEVFKDIGSEYLECGQGYCQDEAEIIVKIGKKFYNVHVHAELGSAKQDRGDRLYWVEEIDRVTYEEIEKPKEKEELHYSYKIKLNKDTKKFLENLLKENSFEFEVE